MGRRSRTGQATCRCPRCSPARSLNAVPSRCGSLRSARNRVPCGIRGQLGTDPRRCVGTGCYAGGHFNNACLPPRTGWPGAWSTSLPARPAPWTAGRVQRGHSPPSTPPSGVWDLTTAGGNLYALGEFTTVNGTSRPGIARFPMP